MEHRVDVQDAFQSPASHADRGEVKAAFATALAASVHRARVMLDDRVLLATYVANKSYIQQKMLNQKKKESLLNVSAASCRGVNTHKVVAAAVMELAFMNGAAPSKEQALQWRQQLMDMEA
jgi:hypothetical protein